MRKLKGIEFFDPTSPGFGCAVACVEVGAGCSVVEVRVWRAMAAAWGAALAEAARYPRERRGVVERLKEQKGSMRTSCAR